jgi:protein translocase SecG subunit
MIALLLAGSGFGYYALATIFVIVSILLVFIVVITPSQEGGMAAAFGGMGSDSFFGTKAHQHINKFMVFLAVTFLALAIVLNYMNSTSAQKGSGGPQRKPVAGETAPAPPGPAPAPAPAPAPPK